MGDRIFVGIAVTLSLAGCVVVADLESHEVASGAADAGPGADAGEVVPLNCDKTKAPKDEPCLLDDVVGVFVSPNGKDDNPGTRGEPTRTITAAILKVGTRRRVFVCEGEYDESLTLVGGGTGHVSIYGGFECGGWSYSASNTKPRVAPKLAGIPLRINGANDDIVIQDMAFVAHDATDSSASSIAAFVNQSTKVDFARVQIVAGAGKAGAEPPAATGGWILPRESLGGHDSTGANVPYTPGFRKTCKCPVGQSEGGGGGYYNTAGEDGSATPYAPVDPANPNDNGAHANAICGVVANNGAPGLPGLAGVPATAHGRLTVDGWIPSRGGDGASGNPGQGGGGGSGGNNAVSKGAGGGGGCGGCGGAGGAGATAGGASIAIVIRQSKVTLVDSELTATDGGAGGTGGRGEDSEGGWVGGSKSAQGCNGGAGGTGASGSGGAGGHGGLSAGMLFPRNENPLPTWDSAPIDVSAPTVPRIRVGKAGDAGHGGLAGTPAQFANRGKQGPTGVDGSAGIAQPVIVVD